MTYYGRRAPVHMAAATFEFLAIYEAYTNGHGKWQAAQAWQDLAQVHPGGEKALRAEIEAVFKRGILKRPPYDRPFPYCPTLHTFLVERRWEDRIGGPAAKPGTLRVVREEIPDLPPVVQRPAPMGAPGAAPAGRSGGDEGGGTIQGIASRAT